MLATDLIAALKSAVCDAGEDLEVRLAIQPSWPFEYDISKWSDIAPVELEDGSHVVYLPEGTQLNYLPGVARDILGW